MNELTTTTPMTLLQTAVSSGASIEQLQQLMALQERWEANEARKAYVAAMTAFKAEPLEVVKNRQVSYKQTNYRHADLAAVVDAVVAKLTHHGLSHAWSVDQSNGIAVTCTITHEQGHSESVTMRGPADESGSKNPIQAIASTVTYLQRYTLMSITGLAAKEMDTDGRTVVDWSQYEQWFVRIEEAADVEALDAIANDLRAASLPARPLRDIRAVWMRRKRALESGDE